MTHCPFVPQSISVRLSNVFLATHRWRVALLLVLGAGGLGSSFSSAIAQPVLPPPASPSLPLTWETYTALTSLPAQEIAQLTLQYEFRGWSNHEITVALTKTPDGYRTDTGDLINAALVESLSASLTQLRWSSGVNSYSCIVITDNYPSFQLDIEFSNGERTVLRSTSNCSLNIPWYVTYQGTQYVQYTGEIPRALYPLLAALPADPFELQDYRPISEDLTGVGEIPVIRSSASSESQIAEANLYRDIIVASESFAPFAPFYDLSELTLFCDLVVQENPQCLNLEGNLTLQSKTSQVVFSIYIRINGAEVSTLEVGSLYLDLGEYVAALDYYQAELAQLQENAERNSSVVGSVLTQIGWAHHKLGEYAIALDYYQQALDTYAGSSHYRTEIAQALNYQGQTYFALGHPETALSNYQQAQAVLAEWGEEVVRWQTLMNLGASYHHLGQHEAALNQYRRAESIYVPIQGRVQEILYTKADALDGAGSVYTTLERHERAATYHLSALFHRQDKDDYIGEILTLIELGDSLTALNELTLALVFLKQAIHRASTLQQDGLALSHKQQRILADALPEASQSLANLLSQTDRLTEAQLAQAGEPWPATITPVPLLPPERVLGDLTVNLSRELAQLRDAQRSTGQHLRTFIDSSETQSLIHQIDNLAR